MAESYEYKGLELGLFAQAINWKCYIFNQLKKYVRGHVLEVGTGLGDTTKVLMSGKEDSWTCLEPDRFLAKRFAQSVSNKLFPNKLIPKIIIGTIDHLKCNRKFDTILYIDVLEHIEDDGLELEKASNKLSIGGSLIVLAPAHQWLYSEFDRSIGHYRRYNRNSLAFLSPKGCKLHKIFYMDIAGLFASASNKLVLRKELPTLRQIIIWDRLLVPVSKVLDFISYYKFGKSIVAVWYR
jgi:hypothetical protein